MTSAYELPPILEFDANPRALINADEHCAPHDIPSTIVLCFFYEIIEKLLADGLIREVLAMGITKPQDLAGKKMASPVFDSVRKAFPIYAKDRGGHYLLSNRAHAAFYGRTPAQMLAADSATTASRSRSACSASAARSPPTPSA